MLGLFTSRKSKLEDIRQAIKTLCLLTEDHTWEKAEQAKRTIMASPSLAMPLLAEAIAASDPSPSGLIQILNIELYGKTLFVHEDWVELLISTLNDGRQDIADVAAGSLCTTGSLKGIAAVCEYILRRPVVNDFTNVFSISLIPQDLNRYWKEDFKHIPAFEKAISKFATINEPNVSSSTRDLIQKRNIVVTIGEDVLQDTISQCMAEGPTEHNLKMLGPMVTTQTTKHLAPLLRVWGNAVLTDLEKSIGDGTLAQLGIDLASVPAPALSHPARPQSELDNLLNTALSHIRSGAHTSVGFSLSDEHFERRVRWLRAWIDMAEGSLPNELFLVLKANRQDVEHRNMTLQVGDPQRLDRCRPPDYELARVLPKGTIAALRDSGCFGYSNYALPGAVIISMDGFNKAIRDLEASVYQVVDVLLPHATRPQFPNEAHGYAMIDRRHWNEFRRNEVLNARDDERRAYWYQYFSKVPIPGSPEPGRRPASN